MEPVNDPTGRYSKVIDVKTCNPIMILGIMLAVTVGPPSRAEGTSELAVSGSGGGRLAECCGQGINEETLKAAGLGQPLGN